MADLGPRHLVIPVAYLLIGVPAKGTETVLGFESDLDCAYCAPVEFDGLVVLLGDDALRTWSAAYRPNATRLTA